MVQVVGGKTDINFLVYPFAVIYRSGRAFKSRPLPRFGFDSGSSTRASLVRNGHYPAVSGNRRHYRRNWSGITGAAGSVSADTWYRLVESSYSGHGLFHGCHRLVTGHYFSGSVFDRHFCAVYLSQNINYAADDCRVARCYRVDRCAVALWKNNKRRISTAHTNASSPSTVCFGYCLVLWPRRRTPREFIRRRGRP